MVKKPRKAVKARKAVAKKARKTVAKKAAKPAKRLRDQTPHIGDDHEVRTVRRQESRVMAKTGARSAMATKAAGWRVALALNKLLAQINAKCPARSKASDGAIGDPSHQSRASDHNPWVIDRGQGVVTARDFTHDPGHGCDCTKLAESIRGSRDVRIKYVIWNRRICTPQPKDGAPAWAWRPYVGKNGHTHHMHLSVKPVKSAYDSEAPWSLSQM
jgi:hypothetical protein